MNFIRTVRAKLIGIVSVLGFFVVAVAVLSMLFIKDLEREINSLTDVVTPTIETSDDLIANLWESGKVANEILATEDPDEMEALAAEFVELQEQFSVIANELDQLFDEPQEQEVLAQVVGEHGALVVAADKMIQAHRQELAEEINAKTMLKQFDETGAKLIVMLDEFAIENEAEMAKAENEGDRLAEVGYATAADVNDVLGALFDEDYPVVEAALKLQRLVVEMQDTSSEYLLEEDPEALPKIREEFDQLASALQPHFKILEDLAETEEDSQDAKELVSTAAAWIDFALSDEMLFDNYRDQLKAEYDADAFTEGLEAHLDRADALLEDIASAADSLSDNADEQVATKVDQAMSVLAAMMAAAVLLGVVGLFVALRVIVSPIDKLVDRLRDIADGEGDLTQTVDDTAKDELGEMARAFNRFVGKIRNVIAEINAESAHIKNAVRDAVSGAERMRHSLIQQSEEIDSVATAITEVNVTSQDMAKNTAGAAEATGSANAEAKTGQSVVNSSVGSVDKLAGNINASTEVVSHLSLEVESIATVLDVIRSIAEQTNLLALNAAIEAARAGNQGRGFAVVADEVRSLAARTQNSTEEIQGMIESLKRGAESAVASMNESKSDSDSAVDFSAQAGTALENIVVAVATVDEMNAQIATAVEEMSQVTQEISANTCRVSELSRNSAEEADGMGSTISGLDDVVGRLNVLVNQFKT